MSDSRYVVLRKGEDLDPKKLRYRKLTNIWDIRYKEEDVKRSKTIYLQSPALRLSWLEEDDHNYYMIFKLGEDDTGFWDLVASLDMASLEEMCAIPNEWNFVENTPIAVLEHHFLPTLRISTTNFEHSFYLTVPKTDQVTLFDAQEQLVEMSDVEVGCKMTLLLLLDGVKWSHNYYHLHFILEQAKVQLAEVVEVEEVGEEVVAEEEREYESDKEPIVKEECLLTHSDSENSNYESKQSNRPKEEVYESRGEK